MAARPAHVDHIPKPVDVDLVELGTARAPDAHERGGVTDRVDAVSCANERVTIADVAVEELARQTTVAGSARKHDRHV